MKQNKVLTTGLGVVLGLTGLFGLTACGSGDGDSGANASAEQAADVDIKDDLENAKTAVADALAEDDS